MLRNDKTYASKNGFEMEQGERGAALVVAMLVMVICALLGASAIMTSTTDLHISKQDRIYHQAFANADGGVQWLMSQDLNSMYDMLKTGGTTMAALEGALSSLGSTTGIRFRPTHLGDPREEETQMVYPVRVEGTDSQGTGRVVIAVEMRVPPRGEIDRPGGPHAY